jgi:hypothetical protein
VNESSLLELVLGPLGALVVCATVAVQLWRENRSLRRDLDAEKDERLKDAKDSQKLAEAYLKLRVTDREEGAR